MIFTNSEAWASASTGLATIDFAGLGGDPDPGADPDKWYPSGLTVDGVTFQGVVPGEAPYLYVRTAGPDYSEFLFGPPSGSFCYFGICYTWPSGSGIDVTLPPAVTSVSWYFANTLPSGIGGLTYPDGLEVQFSDGTTYLNDFTGSEDISSGGPQFVGFTSTVPISSFEIFGPGYPTVENFSLGTALSAETVPEPGPLLSAGVGILVALFCSSRLRKGLGGQRQRTHPANSSISTNSSG